MKELDLLKKDWNKNDNYPKFSEQEIYAMLHKTSSSAVKWIFIISIIEFTFGILLNVGMNFTKSHKDTIELLKSAGIFTFYQIASALIWMVAIYFIYRFYRAYRGISTIDNVKLLMQNILDARKIVKSYIIFNLVAGTIFLLVVYSFVIDQILSKVALEQHKVMTTGVYIGAFAGVIAVTAIFIGGFWLIYRLLYGFLLNRLKKNYNELQKIEY
ncbi:hypothetical protein [Flavobacterium sp.]|uniref:hypothetical protein n=1 Tax=Flavobacterium sp. TaxID=239 RepID=UPI003751C51D